LASAYGVAVAGTMLITSVLTFFVIRHAWHYPLAVAFFATGFFIIVDLLFFGASLIKVADGGWFPLVVGAAIFVLMTTWRRGRELLLSRLKQSSTPLKSFLKSLMLRPPSRVPGTAVFLTSTPDSVPHALLHNLAHNKVLHERVVFLTAVIKDIPWVSPNKRMRTESLGHGCYRMTLYFGFKDRPDVTKVLERGAKSGLKFRMLETSFFLSRETVIPTLREKGMVLWREHLFAALSRNAGSAVEYFNLPANRVIEVGTQVEI
jgi:KUP system potassium uptake protein